MRISHLLLAVVIVGALALVRHTEAPGDPAGLAATLLRALVIQRPLRRGNEQVALAATLQFLAVNGWDLEPDPPGPIADLRRR